ncbi:hypothetical protein FB451DRAFT_1360042 [Mycena latifolia]|nr:hypothetical protein FB451DRAFT_1360042 [Mycena latifolia]
MQSKVIAFIAVLVTSAAAQTGCVTILDGAVCPVGYEQCGPITVGETHCCPRESLCSLSLVPWGLGGTPGVIVVPTTARVNPSHIRHEPRASRVAKELSDKALGEDDYQGISSTGVDTVRRRPALARVVRKVTRSGLQHVHNVMDPV